MLLVFLGKGVESYELGCFLDVFTWDKYWGSKEISIETVALHDEIKCMGGNLKIKPDMKFDDLDLSKYSALAIPGGFCDEGFFDDMYDERFLDLIRSFDSSNKLIASICVASLPLGKSGILKDRNATTFKSEDNKRRNELKSFGANVLDQELVVDRNIITSTGPSSGINVSLKLLELLTSKDNSENIKKQMGF